MKRKIMLVIMLNFIIILSACSGISKIKDNFIDAGYTYSQDTAYIAESLSLFAAFDKDDIDVTIYVYTKPSKVAVIIEFDNKGDMESSLENNKVLINLTSKYDVEDITKRKYLVIPITSTEDTEQEIIDIFQD